MVGRLMRKVNYSKQYERDEARKKKIAQTIWENPFMSGISHLTRKELELCIEALTEKLSAVLDEGFYEKDIKCIIFDEKCNLIECLDTDFFKRSDNE